MKLCIETAKLCTDRSMRKPAKRAPLDAGGLWEFALKTLGARACSAGELRRKLQERAGRIEDVEATLVRLKEYRYLDDRRYAEAFAAARLENQRLGRRRVVRELIRRQVAPALAEAATGKTYLNVEETALIEEYIQRRYRDKNRVSLFRDERDLASAYRRLLRAGFSPGNIIRTLKRFTSNPDVMDGFETLEREEE
jgi:regulatory protein